MLGRGSCVLDLMYKVKNDKRYIVLYILGYLINCILNWKKRKKKKGIEETYTRRNSLLEHNTHTHMYVC